MKKFKIVHVLLFVFLMGLISSTSASAASISYSFTDLGDQQWQIDYQLTDFNSDVYDGVTIYFDYSLYGSIGLTSYDEEAWDILVVQSEEDILGVSDDGYVDVQPLNHGGILTGTFSVTVTLLSDEQPGSQGFELYNENNWDEVATGTTSPVPVPGALSLLMAGLCVLAMGKRN